MSNVVAVLETDYANDFNIKQHKTLLINLRPWSKMEIPTKLLSWQQDRKRHAKEFLEV